MLHSEFTKRHAWMNGLQEYYEGTEYEENYNLVYKALYHKNKYRLRDLIIELQKNLDISSLSETDINTIYNVLLYEELLDYDVKARTLASIISILVKDPYIERLYQFLLHFHHHNIINVPDMNDFFSRGQVKSKIWLINELKKVITSEEIGNIVMYGGWYNFLAHMLEDNFTIGKIYSLDLDEKVIEPMRSMYRDLIDYRIRPITTNVDLCKWEKADGLNYDLYYVDEKERSEKYTKYLEKHHGRFMANPDEENKAELKKIRNTFGFKKIGNVDIVINTSCEHMSNKWFDSLPPDTIVCLQTNDYFDNPQHKNCVEGLPQAKSKYPMKRIVYEGELKTELYTRFMLIGIK